MRFRSYACWTALFVMTIGGLATGSDGWAGQETARFYDPDGNPLPFETYEEVEQFLQSADIVSMAKMSVGTNKHKRKVVLQQGAHRAHAILRTGYEVKETPGDDFVDSYTSELAAYELAGLLGLDTIPPVVRRKGGSLQIWIENATTDASRRESGREPVDPELFAEQMMDMHVFDNLIANTDRNPGNILIDGHGRVWFIDHTRSFAGQEELKYPEKITGCSPNFRRRLQTVSDEAIEQAVKPYIKGYVRELLIRRDLLVDAVARQSQPPAQQ